MRVALVTKDKKLRMVCENGFLKKIGKMSNVFDADVVLCTDIFLLPSDSKKIYLYSLLCYEEMLNTGFLKKEDVFTEFPLSIPGHENAFCVNIHFVEALEELSKQHLVEKEILKEKIVLLVDDHEENLEKIVSIPNAIKVSSPEEAIAYLISSSANIACVITDMCMPILSVNKQNTNFKEMQSTQPAGILVCMAATKRGVPVGVVSTGHYASPMEAFFIGYMKNEGIPYIGCGAYKEEKHWLQIYNRLIHNE